MIYAVNVFGWLYVAEAPSKAEFLANAKAVARGASLLPSDVTMSCISRATKEQIAWYRAQGGNERNLP